MNFFEDAREVIVYTLENKKTIRESLSFFASKNIRSDFEINTIKDLVINFFMNFYFYEKLAKDNFSKLTNVLMASLGISVVALKKLDFPFDEVHELMETTLKKNKEKISDKIDDILRRAKQKEAICFRSVKESFESKSIKYNLPVWFIKMTTKQLGEEKANLIFESFKTRNKPIYMINKIINEPSEAFENITELTYSRVGDGFKPYSYLETKSYFDEIFGSIEKRYNSYVTVYQGETSNLYFRFINEYINELNTLNIGLLNYKNNMEVVNEVILKNLDRVFVYESSESEMIAHLSYKQDVVIYLPKSSNTDRFYRSLDYRFNFDTSSLDSIIENQRNGLKEMASHVEEKGSLIYVVNCVDLKETTEITKHFLRENNEFSLVKEKFILPSKNSNELGYFAIFLRK